MNRDILQSLLSWSVEFRSLHPHQRCRCEPSGEACGSPLAAGVIVTSKSYQLLPRISAGLTCGPTVVAGSIKTDSGSQKHEDLDRLGGPGETTETVEQSLEFADLLELEAMKVTALREHRTRMCSLRSLIQVERNLVLVLVLKDLNFFDLTLEFMVAMMD